MSVAMIFLVGPSLVAASADDRARGQIRLWAPLSSLPSTVAASEDGRFVLASTADGSVSIFDVNSRYGQAEVLISSPIRDEEFQRQRPFALAPSGDLVALGAPRERNSPDSARVYFFKRTDNKRILFTIDRLPARPTELRFTTDRDGKRLLLAAAFADKQPPRIWDVTKIRDASRDPAVEASYTEHVLPEPTADFFSECGRRECHSFALTFPPNQDSPVGLAVGMDSGFVLYDRSFEVAAYGYWNDNRAELWRIASISFSPDGSRFAVGKKPQEKKTEPGQKPETENASCQIDIYDLKAVLDTGDGKKLRAGPTSALKPPEHKGLEPCYLSHVIWTKDAIFSSGAFVAPPPNDRPCKTFKSLDKDYSDYANLLVRWTSPDSPTPDVHCIGANTAMDLQAFPGGGVVVATQDPTVIVYDSKGDVSRYPRQGRALRQFDGPILDLRDEARGDLSLNSDGSIVYFRPLQAPRTHIAFDVTPPATLNPYVSLQNEGIEAGKTEVLKELQDHRQTPVAFSAEAQGPGSCLGLAFPQGLGPLTQALKDSLKFRPTEVIRTFQFLPPGAGEKEWRIVIGTSHRLVHASCDGRDLWNGDKAFAEVAFSGVSVRNDAYRLGISGDGKLLVAAHADGILSWYRMSTGQHILSVFLHPDMRSWIAWTAEGYFDRSDSSGGQIAGWLQSDPGEKGTWSVNLQPLNKYEDTWRNPEQLRRIISGAGDDTPIQPAQQAPDNGRPQLSLQIVGGDSVTTPTVRWRVLASSYDETSLLSPLVIGIEGMGSVKLVSPKRSRTEQGLLIEGSFQLDPCLQAPDKRYRVWARFERSKDQKYLSYAGTPSGVTCEEKTKVWGVVIGISKYENGAPSLRYADQDAERFFNFWKDQGYYDVGRLSLLTAPLNAPAKRETAATGKSLQSAPIADAKYSTVRDFVRSEIAAIKDGGIKPTDLLLVYFAGHGFSSQNEDAEHWYFMPSDGDMKKPGTTAFDIPKLNTVLRYNELNVETPILLFIDACRSSSSYSENYNFLTTKRRSDFNELRDSYNATIFLATSKGKAAYEFPEKYLLTPTDSSTCETQLTEDKGGGAFTHVLLNILNGRGMDEDGQIPLRAVEQYLTDDVKKICLKQDFRKIGSEEFRGFFWKN